MIGVGKWVPRILKQVHLFDLRQLVCGKPPLQGVVPRHGPPVLHPNGGGRHAGGTLLVPQRAVVGHLNVAELAAREVLALHAHLILPVGVTWRSVDANYTMLCRHRGNPQQNNGTTRSECPTLCSGSLRPAPPPLPVP